MSRRPLVCELEASVADRGDVALALAALERGGVEVRGVELLLQVVDAAELLGVVGLVEVLTERASSRPRARRSSCSPAPRSARRPGCRTQPRGRGCSVVVFVLSRPARSPGSFRAWSWSDPYCDCAVVQVVVLLASVNVAGVSAVVPAVEPVAHLVVPLSPECVGNDGKPPDGLFVSPKRATTSTEPLCSHYPSERHRLAVTTRYSDKHGELGGHAGVSATLPTSIFECPDYRWRTGIVVATGTRATEHHFVRSRNSPAESSIEASRMPAHHSIAD